MMLMMCIRLIILLVFIFRSVFVLNIIAEEMDYIRLKSPQINEEKCAKALSKLNKRKFSEKNDTLKKQKSLLPNPPTSMDFEMDMPSMDFSMDMPIMDPPDIPVSCNDSVDNSEDESDDDDDYKSDYFDTDLLSDEKQVEDVEDYEIDCESDISDDFLCSKFNSISTIFNLRYIFNFYSFNLFIVLIYI